MRSIRTRLVLLSAGLILMVTAILTGVIAMNASRVLHSTLQNALSQQIRQGSDLFLNFLKWQSLNLEVWDSQPFVKVFFKSPALAVLTRSGLEGYLSRACDKAPWIADILLVDHDTVLYDHAFPRAPSSRQSGQGAVFWSQLLKGGPFLMNLGQLHPDQDRWVLVLSRQVSDEGKPEPGRIIALFLDLAQVNKALFLDLAVGHQGFLTFAGLLPDGRMVLPDTTARTDVEREFFTAAAAWNRPRDIPQAQGMILLKGTTLPGFPILLIGVASRQDFQQPVQVLIMNSLLIGLFILAVGILGAGVVVTIANNGLEAVSAVKTGNYDAVLMDVQMPVMDGYTASREIRNLKSEFRNLPIIAMTAHAMAGDEQKSMDAGMNGHVTKPIDPDQLFAALQKWIKPSEKRVQVQQPEISGKGAKKVQALPDEEQLPESLPGFDLAAGMARLMNNKRLYRKLLLDFGANYGAVAAEIREAMAANNFTQAHSLVHNLKGLAGNLAATDLQAAAVAMEKLVKGQTAETASDKELNQQLTTLERALELALDAVQILGHRAEKKSIESTAAGKSSVPPELAKKMADRIKAAAEMGDVMLIKSIAESLKSESDAVAPFCNRIVQLAEDFDFDGIQKSVLDLDS